MKGVQEVARVRSNVGLLGHCTRAVRIVLSTLSLRITFWIRIVVYMMIIMGVLPIGNPI